MGGFLKTLRNLKRELPIVVAKFRPAHSLFRFFSLLNKPLHRSYGIPYTSGILLLLTQLRIVGQWILAISSGATHGWSALVITAWILFCATASAYAYPAEENARDWLNGSCSIEVRQVCAEFSCRRAMLTALLYLNRDSSEGRTAWINPILADSKDRRGWEAAVLERIQSGESMRLGRGDEYWWKYVDEGLEVGKKLQKSMECDRKAVQTSQTL